MAKRDPTNLVLKGVRPREQNGLHNALLAPLHQLPESAKAFAEWHTFIMDSSQH